MGSGTWTRDAYCNYVTTAYNCSVTSTGGLDSCVDFQTIYAEQRLNALLNPYKVVRECKDSAEHPNTVPVILALDVTGSMGSAAEAVAKQLNVIMTDLYDKVTDIEFLFMGIGDLDYDRSPIQATQFESDIRIASQLDKVYFEFGGGGNKFESYTAAWYFASRHTNLDCWNRGKKGIIITMGDEWLNPYLPRHPLNDACGDDVQADINTPELYNEVIEKYDIYHINVYHGSHAQDDKLDQTWNILGSNYKTSDVEGIKDAIAECILNSLNCNSFTNVDSSCKNENGEICW